MATPLKSVAVLGLGALLGAGEAFAAFVGDVSFIGGARRMSDKTFWEDIDKPIALGVQASFGASGFPVFGELSLQASVDAVEYDDIDLEATGTLVELSGGALLAPWHGRGVSPYIGVGVTGLIADVEVDPDGAGKVSDDDSSVGYYAHAGVNFLPASRFNLGLDFRIVRGTDIRLFGEEGDADYEQYAITLGYRWGGARAPSSGPSERPRPASAPVAAPAAPPTAAPLPVQRAAPPPAPVAAPRPMPQAGAARTAKATALRQRPQSASSIETRLGAGTALVLQSPQTNNEGLWWWAEAQGASGWISESDVVR